jgi:hypothetical protein
VINRPFPRRGRFVNFLGQTLVRLQDVEFRVPIAAIQVARRRTGTVGLGGNGQFSRLSALDMVTDEAGRPWRGALLENYELGIHMLLVGERNEFTRETHVDQEGLPDLRRLVRRRTRWGQGNMQCGIYLPRLWASRHVSKIGALEATYYLLQPWLQLAGSIVYPFPLVVFLANYLRNPSLMTAWLAQGWLMLFALYFILGPGPYLAWGAAYRRCKREADVIGAIGLGFGYSLYVLMFYITSWRAFCRIVWRRREWFKTRRNAEFLTDIEGHSPPAPVGGIQVIREMAAMPAVAAAPNEAYAASVFGRIYAPPIGLATYPTGTHSVTLPHISIPGLLTTWTVTDKAGPTSAFSNVLTVRARLTRGTTLSAKAVYSSCRFHTRTGTVSSYALLSPGGVKPGPDCGPGPVARS